MQRCIVRSLEDAIEEKEISIAILRSKNDALQKELGKYVERIKELQRIVVPQPLYEYMAKYINKTNAVSGRKRKADEAFSLKLSDSNEPDDDDAVCVD